MIPAALLVGVLIGGYLTESSVAQSVQTGFGFPVESLPPHPAQVVNLADDGVQLQPGQKVSIYSVPATHWLVVSAWNLDTNQRSLLESSGGNEVLKVVHQANSNAMRHTGGPCGIVFKPGSQVVLRNDMSVSTAESYMITGYLVRR
ncbi:MAG: hypothetical protein ACF8XB_18050 [Planctomycetota bacterium JB042]